MAALTIDPKQVALVRVNENGMQSFPAASAFNAATCVAPNASGRVAPNGNVNGFIAVKSARNAGDAVTCVKDAYLDLGDALSGLAHGAPVYAAPSGALDNTATGNVQIGHVVGGYGSTTPDKLLRVNL